MTYDDYDMMYERLMYLKKNQNNLSLNERTKKVIEEHSTIGILITTDGSITDIPRDDYVKAEERVVSELRALHKPFIILLNSLNPSSPETRELAIQLSDKYNTGPVISAPLSRLRPDRHAKRQPDLSGMREKIILGPGTCM